MAKRVLKKFPVSSKKIKAARTGKPRPKDFGRELDKKINASFSENALKMMRKRYLSKRADGTQETPADMFHRVSHGLAMIEKEKYGKSEREITKIEADFFSVMANKEHTPAGRTLTNVGNGTPIIASCIVLPIADTLEEIFQTLKEASLLQQAGSGLGFSFGHLRPAGSPTKRTNGMSSGPIEFLKIYNTAFGIIKQQGRHGANMAIMPVHHPDILDFIECKKVEGDIRNFNVSIGITDEFMKAVTEKPNEPWLATWNGKKMKPHKVLRSGNGAVIGFEEVDITAKQLFDKLVDGAWTNGEPGVVNLDEASRTNPLPQLGEIDSTNPCIVGETLIATKQGLMRMDEIVKSYEDGGLEITTDKRVPTPVRIALRAQALATGGVQNHIMSDLELPVVEEGVAYRSISRAFKTGEKKVVTIRTKEGYELVATPDHKVFTTEGWVEARLAQGKQILIQSEEGNWNENNVLPFEAVRNYVGLNHHAYSFNFPTVWSKELGQVLGWLIGDGWIRDKKRENLVGFVFSAEDQPIMEYLKPIIDGFYGHPAKAIRRENGVYHLSYNAQPFVEFCKSLGVKVVDSHQKEVPNLLFTAPREAVIGFLQGLFSADGTVRDNPKSNSSWIALTAKNRGLLQGVQMLLLNLGIKSQIFDRSRKPRTGLFSYTKKSGEKMTYGSDGVLFELGIFGPGRERFKQEIGFLDQKKQERLNNIRFTRFYRAHFTAQVTEVVPSGVRTVYDLTEPITHSMICNGLVVHQCGEQFLHHYDVCNLGSINLSTFVKEGKMDWARLRHVTHVAVRLHDNVIDLYAHPVQKVTDRAQSTRRIGLGIMGFADMLFKLGVKYNSEEGRAWGEKVMSFVNKEAHVMSEKLAKEKGVFALWKESAYGKKKIKLRNAALTTVAPTGSISMFTDCSSGIEPNFALFFTKQDKDGLQYQYLNPVFEAACKKRGIDIKKSGIMDELIKTGSIQNLTSLPQDLRDAFVVSMDISAEDHIKMQAAFQKHVDNSISKTINFPNSATKEEVGVGYVLAWKLKCKGMTFYRDGSRQVQVLNLGTGENIKSTTEAYGTTEKQATAIEKPLNLAIDAGKIAPRVRPEVVSGKTYKVKTGYGTLFITVNDDEEGAPIEVFATLGKSGGFFQEQSEALCRLISTALRSRIKVEEIIGQLKGIRGPMPVMTNRGTILSLPDAIAQVMEEHVTSNGHKASSSEVTELIAVKNAAPQATEAKSVKKESIANMGMMPGCPDCGASLHLKEGCMSCPSCGFSRCS